MRTIVASVLLIAALTTGCPRDGAGSHSGGVQQAQSSDADAGAPATPPAADARAKEEACVDGWLAERKLDSYGSPEGTMYMGGTPLFDEKTGTRTDRLEFVYARHPDAKAKCRP